MYKTAFLLFLFAQSALGSQLRTRGIAVSNTLQNGESNAIALDGATSQSQTDDNLNAFATNIGAGMSTADGTSNSNSYAYASGNANGAQANAVANNKANSFANNAIANSVVNAKSNSTSVSLESVNNINLSGGNSNNSAGNNMFLINLNAGLLQTISIKAGNIFNLMLPGSPNSGYIWVINQPSLINLNLLGLLNLNVLGGTDAIINTSVTLGETANYNFQLNAIAKGILNLNFLYVKVGANLNPLKILTLKVNIL